MKNYLLLFFCISCSNAFSQYVTTKTDTVFGKVLGVDSRDNSIIIENKGIITNIYLDSVISISSENAVSILTEIEEQNRIRSQSFNNNTVGQEMVKYGRLNNIASGLEAVGYLLSVGGALALSPPVIIVGGVVYLVSWIVRTTSYKHIIDAGLIYDGYYKNRGKSRNPIQIIQ